MGTSNSFSSTMEGLLHALERHSFSWETHKASEKLTEIYSIIGNDPQECRDGLHLDSVFKGGAHIFLTRDKDNIWKHRHVLEPLLCFQVFYPDLEINLIKDYINRLVTKFSVSIN